MTCCKRQSTNKCLY